LIAVAMGNAFDDAVEAETAKVVSHPADGIAGRVETQQLRQQNAYFPIVEPTGLETEYDQYGKQSLYSLVAKAKRGGPLTMNCSQWIAQIMDNRDDVGAAGGQFRSDDHGEHFVPSLSGGVQRVSAKRSRRKKMSSSSERK